MTRCHIVVPARYASTRLPGKPLADIAGQPMIIRVLQQVSRAAVDSVVAAVDHPNVLACVEAAGFEAVNTRDDHQSGTDRIMEVAAQRGWSDDDIVVNVQGDEPLMPVSVIAELTQAMLSDEQVRLASMCEPLAELSDLNNPNVVKVVRDINQDALYFSRAPVPYARDEGPFLQNYARHIGIYAYRVEALRTFTSLPMSTLEQIEKLEQLRWLEAGNPIRVLIAPEAVPGGVDTPEDLARIAAQFG